MCPKWTFVSSRAKLSEVLKSLISLSWNSALRHLCKEASLPTGRWEATWRTKAPQLTLALGMWMRLPRTFQSTWASSQMQPNEWTQEKPRGEFPSPSTESWEIINHCCFKPLIDGGGDLLCCDRQQMHLVFVSLRKQLYSYAYRSINWFNLFFRRMIFFWGKKFG